MRNGDAHQLQYRTLLTVRRAVPCRHIPTRITRTGPARAHNRDQRPLERDPRGDHATRGTPALAGLAIGLALTLIHLTSIPVDNTSVNPARSIAAAIYGGTDALAQLRVFILFPIVGALLAGFAHRALFERTNI